MNAGYTQLGPTGKRLIAQTGDGSGVIAGRQLLTPPTEACCCNNPTDYFVDIYPDALSDLWHEKITRMLPDGWRYHRLDNRPAEYPATIWWHADYTTLAAAIAHYNTYGTWPTVTLGTDYEYTVAGFGQPAPMVQGDSTWLLTPARGGALGTVATVHFGVALVKTYAEESYSDGPCEAASEACSHYEDPGVYNFAYDEFDLRPIDYHCAAWHTCTADSALWGKISEVLAETYATVSVSWPGFWPVLADLLAADPSPLWDAVFNLDFAPLIWNSGVVAGYLDYYCNTYDPWYPLSSPLQLSYARTQQIYVRAAASRHLTDPYDVTFTASTASVVFSNGPFQTYREGIGNLCNNGGATSPPRSVCMCELPPYPYNCLDYPPDETRCMTPPYYWTVEGATTWYEGLRFGVFAIP